MKLYQLYIIMIVLFGCLLVGRSTSAQSARYRLKITMQENDGMRPERKVDTIFNTRTVLKNQRSMALNNTPTDDCACNCLQPFFDYVVSSGRLFTRESQHVLVSTLIRDAIRAGYPVAFRGCPLLERNVNKYFYAVTAAQSGTEHKVRLGDCVVAIRSANGASISFGDLKGTKCVDGRLYTGSEAVFTRKIVSNKTFVARTVYKSTTFFPGIPIDPGPDSYFSSTLDTSGNKFFQATAIQYGESFNVIGYAVFDSLATIPSNAVVKTARLKMYADTSGGFHTSLPNAHTTGRHFGLYTAAFTINSSTPHARYFAGPWMSYQPDINPIINTPFDNLDIDVRSWLPDILYDEGRAFALLPRSVASGMSYATFYSHKCPDISKRPAIEITYAVPLSESKAEIVVDSCYSCTVSPSGICYSAVTDTSVNPYVYNLAGNWRPLRSFVYYGDRAESDPSNPTNIRTDGAYADFIPFWAGAASGGWSKNADTSRWVWNAESTLFNKKGFELENKDPLGRFNAGLYGYDDALPVAVVNNSHYRESAFDGFEDYFFGGNICDTSCSVGRSVDFSAYKAHLVTSQQHTGRYSLKVNANSSAGITASLTAADAPMFGLAVTKTPNDCGTGESLRSVRADSTALLPSFSPLSGRKVLVSLWVKEEQECKNATYTGNQVSIQFKNGTADAGTITAKPAGGIIEGWQRYEIVAAIPASATKMSVLLQSTGSSAVFFDDLRIHPYNANMKSFVYDAVNLRLMSELDENNYATFYEYDDDGTLIRLKKETERGIKTITEKRSGLIKE